MCVVVFLTTGKKKSKEKRKVQTILGLRKCCQGNIFSGFLMVENIKKSYFYRTLFFYTTLPNFAPPPSRKKAKNSKLLSGLQSIDKFPMPTQMCFQMSLNITKSVQKVPEKVIFIDSVTVGLDQLAYGRITDTSFCNILMHTFRPDHQYFSTTQKTIWFFAEYKSQEIYSHLKL